MSELAPFESSISERYHEETKYSEVGLRRAASNAPLDWGAQPVPFKQVVERSVLLPIDGLPIERTRGESLPSAPVDDPTALDAAKLSRILWHTNGCTRIVRHAGGIHHFRAAPSAGGMYPTEVYVAVADVPGIQSGTYLYHLLEHSLVPVQGGDPTEMLSRALFGHPAAEAPASIILTAEWYRSSWRYRERGYRRALLDTGHVAGNLELAAAAEGRTAVLLADFRDDLFERLLGVDAATEGPLVVAPLVHPDDAGARTLFPPRRSETVEWHSALAAVAPKEGLGEAERLIAACHCAGRLDSDASPVGGAPLVSGGAPEDALAIPAATDPTLWTDDDPITDSIAARRSTRSFRDAPIPKDALLRTLAFAEPEDGQPWFAPGLLRTYVVSLDVVGLPPGCYLYEHDPRQLRELTRGRLNDAMLHLGLGQEIFRHPGAVVVHTADLTRAVGRYGDRIYRSLGLDAGRVGERLNLAALHEGLGVSGCAGYYDDEMNRLLAIPESQAVIYLTCLGLPAGEAG